MHISTVKPIALGGALLMLASCASTAYTPLKSPYLKTVVVDNQLKYRVDGKNYGGGPLGSLAEAVATVPEAKAYAEEAESDALWALVNVLGGSTLMGLGTGLAVISSTDNDISDAATVSFAGLAVVGVVMMFVGITQAADSQINQLDAINIYNDVMLEQERLRLRQPPRSSPSERAMDPVLGAPGGTDAARQPSEAP
jgi:hypothetical protein